MGKKCLDKQKVFEKVVTKLIKQGKQSWNEETMNCCYRGDNNTRCAIGVLITDKHYKRSMEGTLLFNFGIVKWAVQKSLNVKLSETDVDFLSGLQSIHDWVNKDRIISEWKKMFKDYGQRNNLKTSFIAKIKRK